ncbi:DNA glycosylase, partial [Acephala macrosclerotiorum]
KAKRQPVKSPFFPQQTTPSKAQKSEANNDNGEGSIQPQTPNRSFDDLASSQTQGAEKKRTSATIVSCIPFPPLSAPHFGLIQEKLAHDPFRLLIAVTFLIRTHGKHAIPVFFELMEKYPTPESLVNAKVEDIVPIIRHLGLQNQRAQTYKTYAETWLDNPPTKGKRYPVKGYPDPESARNVKKDEILSDEDERHAWEIGHMTSGPYAIDSWRIFCRDKLRGVADSWNGEGTSEGFQPEWMRVVPEDKELRAYLRWMWLKEGFEWDPFTGDKEVASPELMRAAMEGRIAWDDQGGMRIIDEGEEVAPGVASQ